MINNKFINHECYEFWVSLYILVTEDGLGHKGQNPYYIFY